MFDVVLVSPIVQAFAAKEGLLQVETSAAHGSNVDLAFDVLISQARRLFNHGLHWMW